MGTQRSTLSFPIAAPCDCRGFGAAAGDCEARRDELRFAVKWPSSCYWDSLDPLPRDPGFRLGGCATQSLVHAIAQTAAFVLHGDNNMKRWSYEFNGPLRQTGPRLTTFVQRGKADGCEY